MRLKGEGIDCLGEMGMFEFGVQHQDDIPVKSLYESCISVELHDWCVEFSGAERAEYLIIW